ncbi:MAG: flavodoxin family protein [Planctomycetes bacterium]|nr:flavodoxin family protein [Planctomycetota bacterium]
MAKILIVYYSRSGNTAKMAQAVEEGVKAEGAAVETKSVDKVDVKELLDVDGLIVGSPTYYGLMAAELKKMFDDSVKFHGRLEGKVGGAFSSAANIGGGNETTIRSILDAMLIHGMVIQGTPRGDHYGPVAISAPDDRARKQCVELGKRTAKLVKKLFG